MIFKFLNGLLRPNTTELLPTSFAISRRGFLVGTGAALAMPMVLKFESIAEAQAAIVEAVNAHPELVWAVDFSIFHNVITASVIEIADLGSLGAGRFVAPDHMARILEDKYSRLARPGIDIALRPDELGLPSGSMVPQKKEYYGTGPRTADLSAARRLEQSINRGVSRVTTQPVKSFQVGDRKQDVATNQENDEYSKEVFGVSSRHLYRS